MAEKKKKWVKKSEGSEKVAEKSEGSKKEEGKSKMAENLKSMIKAHNEKSASNKTIRNGFYGKKD